MANFPTLKDLLSGLGPNEASAEIIPSDAKSKQLAELSKNTELFKLLHSMPNKVALRYWPDYDAVGRALGEYLLKGESGYTSFPEILLMGKIKDKAGAIRQVSDPELLATLQHELPHGLHDATRGIRRWPSLDDPRTNFLGASAKDKIAYKSTLQNLLAEMIAQRMGGGNYNFPQEHLKNVDPFIAEIKGEASKYLPSQPKRQPWSLRDLLGR